MKSNKKLISSIIHFPVIVFGFLCPLTVLSQINDSKQGTDTVMENSSLTVVLAFPGGPNAIHHIIADSAQYPKSAIEDRIGGHMTVYFIIDTLGMVEPYKIKKVSGLT